ncbi:hypothetical protein [Amycolatopsis aidingensis]|uniref:hypothetical protein n=1 Tax=Amycolatopsis aidingensis TaxID=2842453 RepID=UPI001C0DD220|nr:hypothetical protein [Amycolatopsis aidingensis]
MGILGTINKAIDKSAEVAARRAQAREKIVASAKPKADRCLHCKRPCAPTGLAVTWCQHRPACIRAASRYLCEE